MLHTRTGGFPIGFRRGWSEWFRDLDGMMAWAKANGFGVIDLGNDADVLVDRVAGTGLTLGSVDLKGWSDLLHSDPAKRAEAIAVNRAYIEKCGSAGAKNYFFVVLPPDPSRSRKDNMADAIAGLNELAPVLEANGGRIVIEGWPGPGALACTPEGYRIVMNETPACIGINYDPSHLIRMGVDPIRFLGELADRVYHVHGKDTEIMAEKVYEFGTEQEPTRASGHGFGGAFWRYTIPGHGEMRWTEGFKLLKAAGYSGAVSIELEDENFNGSTEGEQAALVAGGAFLASA